MSELFQCHDCGERKARDCFYTTPKATRGHDATCKKCRRKRQRAREQAMREGIIPATPSFRRAGHAAIRVAQQPPSPKVDIDGLALDIAEIISAILKEKLADV